MADVTQVQVGDKYELKDSLARSNKIDKYEDSSVSAVVDFLNGVKASNVCSASAVLSTKKSIFFF